MGRGPPAGRRRRDGVPDDAVPRGGRRAGRPRRHHRPRQDRGRGHAGRAEGGDRPPERRSDPRRPGRPRAPCRAFCTASARRPPPRPTASPRSCPRASSDLAEIVRTLDAEGLAIADLRLHSPTLDDVFLAKTGRSLEGAGDGSGRGGRAGERRAGRRMNSVHAIQVGVLARRAMLQDAAPAVPAVPDRLLPADPARRERERAARGDAPAGLPDAAPTSRSRSRWRSSREGCSR